ncbi:glycine-rich domain-containing protein [Aeromonas veronii]|uniref:glycine-rich domain-containing protein n=1 Tax=Aeromonas veronii TaxID=654 RepID=UPI0035BAB7C2
MITLGGSAGASTGFGRFRNRIEVFDIIPGTRQLTIPEGWNKIRVAVVGGGGGGRLFGGNYGYGGGGSGGGYAEKVFDVTPGQTFTYTVGAGGDINADGGTSSFAAVLSATGGRTASSPSSSNSIGSAGGVGIGGDVNNPGGRGGSGYSDPKGGAGGGGASGHRYGAGGDGSNGELNSVQGVGGSWIGGIRPLLYDDGWGLGITPHDLPIDADLTANGAQSSQSTSIYSRVGQGTSSHGSRPNIGGGSCGLVSTVVHRGGLGAGGGGGYNVYAGAGGAGAVIVEVLA